MKYCPRQIKSFRINLFSFSHGVLLLYSVFFSKGLCYCTMALKDRLTTILVTSPIVSHPSTELMDRVVASFDLVKDLCSCSLLILADGVKCGKFRPKKGVVTSEMVECYDTFLERLRIKISEASSDSIWSRTRMIKMKEHLGFGHVVYYGLRHCQTEYVLVVQHDHPFSVSFR